MARYYAVALLALLAAGTANAAGDKDITVAGKAVDKDITLEGKLKSDDPKDTKRETPCKVHVFKFKKGIVYTIDMMSKQFDSYLRLEDKDGKDLAEDDDSGGNLNARIQFNCTADGDYKVIATTFGAQGAGDYTLTIKQAKDEQKARSGQELLIGKEAPNLKGEFAVNGKAVKLSELQGKVVLLNFWEVRSAPAVASLARLRDWHKAYKADGLEVVGVTFYNFELGHKLGFDKETGKITYIDKAGKDSEQALLRDFAVHHKLEYLLLALPREAALEAFNAYLVNGLPQFVLIDRTGVVRMIRVGDAEKGAPVIEAEIKKLLASP